MIPTKQTILHDPENGKFGNCFSAVLASLLHINIDEVPVFSDNETWQKDLNAWLRQFGLAFMQFEDLNEFFDLVGITGIHHELGGTTKRFTDVSHGCVGFDGKVVFDPHPSNDGLEKITTTGVFLVLEPWRMAEQSINAALQANKVKQVLAKIEQITKQTIETFTADGGDVLWFDGHTTFFDAMSELHDLVSGEETPDLQMKLWPEPAAEPYKLSATEHDILKDAQLKSIEVASEPVLTGRWHHGNGTLVCGTIRIANFDYDTSPSSEFKKELADWICRILNNEVNKIKDSRCPIASGLDRTTGGWIGQP